MPVHTIKNQYRGINAHLHSYWQAEKGWNNFHNRHIGDLAGLLRLKLLPMGYTAIIEDSLQIRRFGDTWRQPCADLLIRDTHSSRPATAVAHIQSEFTVAEMIEGVVENEKPYRAISIYELEDQGHERGEPVTWLELLSPTNKGDTRDAHEYLGKRWLLLDNGLIFVELDYLHHTPSTFPRLADYTQPPDKLGHEAHPYRIAILNPHPDIQSGPAQVTEFDVDVPLPVLEIPLSAGNSVTFDFGFAYQKTFAEMGYGLEPEGNYAELPLNFDRYSEADQTRIVNRMLAVLEAANNQLDLETAPFPITPLPLTAALTQLDALQVKLQG